MDFPTMYDPRDPIYTDPGCIDVPIYSPSVDNDGHIILESIGVKNLPEYIDSFRESCDINNLVARFNAGDVTALSRAQGAFFDATQLPHTYAEMLNTVINAEQTFNSLPLDIREKFDNSYIKWLSMMDDAEQFALMMGVSKDAPSEPAEPSEPISKEVSV